MFCLIILLYLRDANLLRELFAESLLFVLVVLLVALACDGSGRRVLGGAVMCRLVHIIIETG